MNPFMPAGLASQPLETIEAPKRRRRKASFKNIQGRFGKGGKLLSATIVVTADTFSVRPSRSRREYVLPLSDVAEYVYTAIVRTEVAQEKPKRRFLASRGVLGR